MFSQRWYFREYLRVIRRPKLGHFLVLLETIMRRSGERGVCHDDDRPIAAEWPRR